MTTSRAVHSQAFTFMSYLQGGVDPRTGQYTVSLDFPEIKSNWLSGPDFLFNLNFNPINILDSGFGLGWNLNLSQFTPHNSILALSTGETFKVTGSGTEPAIKEKKLDSFHFYNNQDGTYRVVHKSGLIEELTVGGSSDDRVALPTRIYAPSGHSISLTYAAFRGGQRLQSVSDAQGELLRINREDYSVEILIKPDNDGSGKPLARYQMTLDGNGWVTAIVLPTADAASWRFKYGTGPIRGILCLHEVKTPVGGHETIEYGDGGHPYPGGVTRPNLPRVTRHRTYPGSEQPMVEVNYTYTAKNFLGAGETVSWEEGMDPLYTVAHTYEYGSTSTQTVSDKAVRWVDRTYNRFHLLTEEKTTQDLCVIREATTYYAEDIPFERQVPQFQMPKATKTSWEIEGDSTRYRAEVASSAFDENGNLIEEVDPSGVKTVHTYYPKEASDGCPADPEGFIRNRKDSTVVPSPQGQAGALTLRTHVRYTALDPLDGSGLKQWLISESETLQQVDGSSEVELLQTLYAYNNQPGEVFLHGRPASQRMMLNGKGTTTKYTYGTLKSALAGEQVLETVETLTGFDHSDTEHVQKVTTREDSLIHGQSLVSYDDNGVKIRSEYDQLQRVISETVSPDDDEFRATRTYTYYLTSLDGQQAQQEVTDVKKVTTRTFFDGLNRAIKEERQNADSPIRADEYRPTWSASYDALGHLTEETELEWRGEEQMPLISKFDYDSWGSQCCVTGPDGVQVHEQTDPIGTADWNGPIQRSWRQGSGTESLKTGVIVTYLNLFEKPAHIERFDAAGTAISLHQFGYDGLGQTVVEIDARAAKTQYTYDGFGRMTSNTLPGGAVVRRSYFQHSAEDLPIEISVDRVVLGTQAFDGIGRMKEATTGGRTQVFSYLPGLTQPDTVTTASQQLIRYQYNPQLSEEPMRRQLPGAVTADYVYDKQNARLVSCEEQGLALKRQYFSTGELKSEQRDQSGKPYTMHYDYSRQGRLLSYTDVLEQVQRYEYDDAGRLTFTQLGETRSDFTYDDLGQLATISTQDTASGQQVTISLQYDEFGREIKRIFDLNGTEQQLTQVYNAVDALVQRTLSEGDVTLRDEEYGYDPRGRLILYTCKGSQPPVDPYGKAIAQQIFRFDALDNLTLVITTSVDGVANRATYTYDNAQDPTQLSSVKNSAGSPYPAVILLAYDADGHLICDEEQRVLKYDALGRLTEISGLPGEPPSGLGYDPLDTLTSLEGGEGPEQRFYRGGELANRIQGAKSSTFVRADGVVLAEHQAGADPKSLLLASDFKSTVFNEVSAGTTNTLAYSAYGNQSAEQPVATALAYNGVLRETQNGVYLLGNGYRAYSPSLMRFHCPDSWSPFGAGGLNAYVFCGGDPMGNVDLDGHKWYSALWQRISAPFRRSPTSGVAQKNTMDKSTKIGGSAGPAQSSGEKNVSKRVDDLTEKGYQANIDFMDQRTRKNPKLQKIQQAADKRKKLVQEREKVEREVTWGVKKKHTEAVYDANRTGFKPSGGAVPNQRKIDVDPRSLLDPDLHNQMVDLRKNVLF